MRVLGVIVVWAKTPRSRSPFSSITTEMFVSFPRTRSYFNYHIAEHSPLGSNRIPMSNWGNLSTIGTSRPPSKPRTSWVRSIHPLPHCGIGRPMKVTYPTCGGGKQSHVILLPHDEPDVGVTVLIIWCTTQHSKSGLASSVPLQGIG